MPEARPRDAVAATRLARPRAQEAIERLARAWNATSRVGLHEAVAVVAAFVVYFLIRGSVVGREGEAVLRGQDVIAFERSLGIYWELQMQSWIIDHLVLIKLMNGIYFWGHMPVVIAFAVWLWVRHRRTYTLVRTAFLASGAIAVLIYWLFPVAPPRLIPFAGFVDTMAVFDRVNYNAQETTAFVNQYAAIPSLHFGWSLLLGAAVVWVARNPLLRLTGALWPVAMFFSVVLTANHFIIDAVAGAIVSFVGLAIALGLERARPMVVARVRERFAHGEPPEPGTATPTPP